MTANKKSTRRVWRDPNDAPDLSKRKWRQRLECADVVAGKKIVRRSLKSSVTPAKAGAP